jgi:cytochrome b
MKEIGGTIGFVIFGLLTFRYYYGAWPPTEGDFNQWLTSDPSAGWAMVAAVVGGMVGAIVVRLFIGKG